MRTKLTLALCLMMLAVPALAGENQGITAWVLGSPQQNNSIEVRVGFEYEGMEAYILSIYWPRETEPQVFGGGVNYTFPDPIEVPNPLVDLFEGLAETIPAYVYAGGKFGIDYADDEDRSFSAWIAGIMLTTDPNKHINLIFEYGWYDWKDAMGDMRKDEAVLTMGMKVKF